MASHKSAIKAHRQSAAQHLQNRQYRSRLRNALKSARAALSTGDRDQAKTALNRTVSIIDRMVTKGVIHRNTAARHKSRLTQRLREKSAAA